MEKHHYEVLFLDASNVVKYIEDGFGWDPDMGFCQGKVGVFAEQDGDYLHLSFGDVSWWFHKNDVIQID